MIISPDDTQIYELNTGLLKVKDNYLERYIIHT
jgi:hypothetical protein